MTKDVVSSRTMLAIVALLVGGGGGSAVTARIIGSEPGGPLAPKVSALESRADAMDSRFRDHVEESVQKNKETQDMLKEMRDDIRYLVRQSRREK